MKEERSRDEIEKERKKLLLIVVVLSFSILLLCMEYIRLKSELDYMRDLLEKYKQVPSGYYGTDSFPSEPTSLGQLEGFLAREFELPEGHREGEWDCSESAAYVEWALEHAGFDAWIVVGKAPWNPRIGYHAWIIVYTDEYSHTYVHSIEPTALTGGLAPALQHLMFSGAPGLVYTGDDYEKGYYLGYEKRYENIYLAIKDSGDVEEWDWWSGS